MWNILIVLIIAVIIWLMNPLKDINIKQSVQQKQKTQSEVNQVVNDVQKQVDYARKIQGVNNN